MAHHMNKHRYYSYSKHINISSTNNLKNINIAFYSIAGDYHCGTTGNVLKMHARDHTFE